MNPPRFFCSRRWLRCIILLSQVVVMAFSAASMFGGAVAMADERPNIVMIFTDDQRFDAAGFAGSGVIQTPHLDRLAADACVLDRCFVNTSICSISRANLLTGQYPARHGIDDFFKTFDVSQVSQTVPARLRASGYQTAFVGKWGIGDSPDKTRLGAAAFDYWAGQPMQTCFFHDADCAHVIADGFRDPAALCDCPADSTGKVGFRNRIGRHGLTDPLHTDSQVTPRHVERFLDGRDVGKPFCAMLFFKGPHSPVSDWDPTLAALTDGQTMAPAPAATLKNAAAEPAIVRSSLGAPSGRRMLENPKQLDTHLRDYARLVSSMDLGVGRVVAALNQRGLAGNTVILFTSDNGFMQADHGLMGKWLMYEPSLRVPGFIYDPRRLDSQTAAGHRRRELVITTDFSVTMLALAGLTKPTNMTGRDLMPLVEGRDVDWREDFYYDHPYRHGGAIPATIGVRGQRFVYTRYVDADPVFEQLFDLQTDPDQLTNLAGLPEHQDRLAELRRRCDQWKESVR